jgi:hypothetical protein
MPSNKMPLEYASGIHPGDARAQMVGALVKRGVPQDKAENAVTAILDDPELRQMFTGQRERR